MHPVPSLSRRPQHPTTACRRSSDPGAPDTGSRDQHRRCIAMCHILRHFASARRSRSSEGRPDQAIAHAQGAAVRSREFGRVGVDWGVCASRSPPGADLICWLPQRISRAPMSALLKPPRRPCGAPRRRSSVPVVLLLPCVFVCREYLCRAVSFWSREFLVP